MLHQLRLRLARADALLHLSALGALTGLLVGVVILLFRFTIEQLQGIVLPGSAPEDHALLAPWQRLLLPLGGGVLIGLLFQWAYRYRQVGIAHVLERLAYHQARIPLGNALMQFIGGALSIASGHSVGREGPGVHLGAANGSLVGQWLGLPNNATRTLVGCGVAGAIGASFNTPLAGVVFAMEVVLMEYSINGFAPVILASVIATAVTRLVYGSAPAFDVPALDIGSVGELPLVLVLGLFIGVLAAAFIHLLQFFAGSLRSWPLWLRMATGGGMVGACAVVVPEVMGIGYDTVNSALLGQLGLFTLGLVVLFKLLATTAGIGLGLPGGLIGPTLVIGASAGGAMGLLANAAFPDHVSSHGFYALLGLAAMMGATLQAPLAALITVLELTATPTVLLPGMLAIIIAVLTSSQLFGKGPLFITMMRARGLDYRQDPVTQSLRRVGVAAVMDRNFRICPRVVPRETAEDTIRGEPRWLLVIEPESPPMLLRGAELAQFLEMKEEVDSIDLGEIPAPSRGIPAEVPIQHSLHDCLERLNEDKVDTALVLEGNRITPHTVYGIVTRHDIETNYRYNGEP